MKFTNKKETKFIPSFYIILFAVLITNIFSAFEIRYDDMPVNYWGYLPGVIALLLIIYLYTTGKSFAFDSEGETVNIKSTGLLLSKFINYRDRHTEIPKKKLKGFNIENYLLFKRLHIYIHSRNSKGYRHYIYNITFLSANKLKALKHSLAGMVSKNKARV